MSDIVQALESFKEVFTIPSRIEELEKMQSYYDQETSDFLHFIEFAKPDAREMIVKYKELRESLRKRRKVKEELGILTSAKEILAYPKPKEKDFNRVIGNVKKLIKSHGNRTYTMRVRTELQEKVNG
ncbi:hypothetical protein [Heyndrickxia camelliae]|uniref:Uncharacterized protein n=1 Tax=Heyndrickxia camelliae TaxID=1707093 RepID=A0A2N3LNK5_9BACI|nr:hypothetical protein [Heyndrickxia camelliae]PKR86114.1 hypothetical protein CWO92_07005 [Heyndrickxia camelliae]